MRCTSASRGEMIGSLVEDSVSTALSELQKHWLKEVFEKGFVGYSKLSDRQLLMEMQLRGLLPQEEESDDDADNEFLNDPMFN